jgi:hypothetical protein
VTLYTVPVGHLVVVRAITVQNEASSTNFVTLDINGTYNIFTRNLQAVGAVGSDYPWEGRVAMAAGSTLRYYSASASKTTDVSAMGYLYFI